MVKYLLDGFNNVPLDLAESVLQTKVEYRQLGNSGLRVSNPIFGGLQIGNSAWIPWVIEKEEALELLKAAYDRGINTWDTANVYSNGESERIIGEAMRTYKIPRDKLVIMTKCYRVMCDEEHYDPGSNALMHQDLAARSKDYVNHSGLSRSAIFNAVNASLKRLGTDYIDVLQIHRYDVTVSPEETMSALHELVMSGKVRYIGASSMWTHQFATLQFTAERRGWTKFISMQNHYNLLYREEEREMNKFCNATGVGLIPWGPFASGRLVRLPDLENPTKRLATTKDGAVYDIKGDDCAIIIARIHEIAKRRKCGPSHVVLAYMNRRVTAPIIGFSSIARMDDALSARGMVLTPEEEAYLEEPYLPKPVIGHE